MGQDKRLLPEINDGRFFVSPILGCTGACSYCYLRIKDFNCPHENKITKSDLISVAKKSDEFTIGKNGGIISVGAWGDIFPLGNDRLIAHSVDVIKYLLSWGNPVQIMSKNILSEALVKEIAHSIEYPGQLVYSTTITSINYWEKFEPGTVNPVERLKTCSLFKKIGVPTNVLIKPFLPGITDREIDDIVDMIIDYDIDYVTLGVLYCTPQIVEAVNNNSFLAKNLDIGLIFRENHLDCNGKDVVSSTLDDAVIEYMSYLKSKKIKTFLKSSCVSSNVLGIVNPSKYYINKNKYCIACGNCKIKGR